MNINEIGEFATALLILIGAVMSMISALGMIRFPDVYTRAHAATKSSTLAVMLTLSGVFLFFLISESFISVRLLLGIVFVFITAPVSGHLVCRAAYRSNVKLANVTKDDELKDVLNKENLPNSKS